MSAALALALYITLFGLAALVAFATAIGVLIIFCSALREIVKEVKEWKHGQQKKTRY